MATEYRTSSYKLAGLVTLSDIKRTLHRWSGRCWLLVSASLPVDDWPGRPPPRCAARCSTMPARLVHSACGRHLRAPQRWPWQDEFDAALRAIAALRDQLDPRPDDRNSERPADRQLSPAPQPPPDPQHPIKITSTLQRLSSVHPGLVLPRPLLHVDRHRGAPVFSTAVFWSLSTVRALGSYGTAPHSRAR